MEKHWFHLEKWLVPYQMRMINMKKYFSEQLSFDFKKDDWVKDFGVNNLVADFNSKCIALDKNYILSVGGQE